eukprot:COSAG02_NODE_7772_length_2853_cov_1.894336_3_plen_49_part_00
MPDKWLLPTVGGGAAQHRADLWGKGATVCMHTHGLDSGPLVYTRMKFI